MGMLETFPISFKVQNKRVLIVGGGEAALARTRLLLMSGARVVVVAKRPDREFFTLNIDLAERDFAPGDVKGAALVFVAADGMEATRAIFAARAAKVPLNVVDRPALSDFYTPAMVKRGPLSIAISTQGKAPVLARHVRARIETMLAPELGALARLGGELRQSAQRLLPEGGQRRRFFADLFSSPAILGALETGVAGARRAALRLLQSHANGSETAGNVWLVGAGPGVPDLLTLRAQRLLQEADVIVAAQGVSKQVVDLGRRDAQRVFLDSEYIGNKPRDFKSLLVELGKKHHSVVFLIPGEGDEFFNSGEIGRALEEAGTGFALVPGVGSKKPVTSKEPASSKELAINGEMIKSAGPKARVA